MTKPVVYKRTVIKKGDKKGEAFFPPHKKPEHSAKKQSRNSCNNKSKGKYIT